MTRVTVKGAEQLAAQLEDVRKKAAKAIRAELVKRAAGGGPPVDESEDTLHLRMANHLHQLLPGANPRMIAKATKAVPKTDRTPRVPARPAVYEPAHPWAMWWHTPNQGKRSVVTGNQFVRMGMRKGFADFGLAFSLDVERPAGTQMPTPTIAQLCVLEAKARDGRLTSEQERFRDDCQRLGVWWAEVRSVKDVDAFLRAQLAPWGRELPTVRIWE
ncbi:VRR-NUC domain-containing protein [Caulobacter phage W2]|uniref:VRR-NUC domain-containing protein n=1 Tax=Caulobacter phage TMCBR4 TaxID=3028191 RepID=A0AAF0CD38_9CAUD|nr:VRR-NUC domain-containing protein [Caulobacter phage TMCBR4]WDS38416.1 VRR-NUC domain-containing protein [Caulobacter phage W2]